METLLLVAHGNKSLTRDGFRSSPSKTFRQINCRRFCSGVCLLPRPKRTSPIPIANSKGSQLHSEFVEERRSLCYSELWAGPTYSNSPPPTSVPIPKFSLRQKRTVSLTFPAPESAVDVLEVAKSAPVSPTSSGDNPFHSSATMTLRRMLNLESADV